MFRSGRALAMISAMLTALCGAVIVPGAPALADPAPFDLAGPDLQVSVTRHGVTLPIATVPQLAPGDRIAVKVMLPPNQTAHYLLVAAFLRDPTNPPPDAWFYRSETWRSKGRGGGPLDLVVPDEARHLALFLAPATGGDFATLRHAVEARPGAFIRAAQDLEQASLDRSRFEAYLAAIRKVSGATPDTLAHEAPTIASALRIKINEDCLQRQAEFQAACLLDSKQAVVLGSDGSANGAVTGAATDLVMNLSNTAAGGAGYYSPYIGAIKDIIGIFGAMHSPRFQYIPALGLAHDNTLGLVLNTPPSFADPKSVLMAALPGIKPPLPLVPHRQPGGMAPCLGAKEPLVPLTISPLYYATAYAHDLSLRVHRAGEAMLDLPLVADPVRGGLVIAPGTAWPRDLAEPLGATLHGMWGFDAFNGPDVPLAVPGDWHWQRKEPGKEDGTLVLHGAAAACVATITAATPHGLAHPASWKVLGPDEIAVTLPPEADRREPVTLAIDGPETIDAAKIVVPVATRPQPPAARIVARFSEPPANGPDATAPNLKLDGADEIPANLWLSFTLKAEPGQHFTGHEVVEVGTSSSDTSVRLTSGNGLTLVDPTVLVVNFLPGQALGGSAYGPLRARLLRGEVAGDWLGIGTLVRLPRLKTLDCPANPANPCTLRGEALYLLASLSATREFDSAASVPDGFPGSTLPVMRPGADGTLFVRLHDAPEIVNHVRFATIGQSARSMRAP